MVKTETLVLGDYRTNCYLVWNPDQDKCVIIDPGDCPEDVLAAAERLGKKIQAIFLTHGHFDHVGAVSSLVDATECQLWMREADCSQEPQWQPLYPLSGYQNPKICLYEEGEVLTRAGLTFTVMETPGHTWGSVCLLAEDALFTGDTLFRCSCGRTDLPGGDDQALQASLARLKALEGEFRIFPGHGPATTLEHEKKFNPYLRQLP